MDAQTLSEQATLDRFNAGQDRIARDFGYGDTEGALGVTRSSIEPLQTFIDGRINTLEGMHKSSEEAVLLETIGKLSSATIAFSILNSALSCVAVSKPWLETAKALGQSIQGECWAAGLLERDPELTERIERSVRRKHGSLKYRQQAARSIAARTGYKPKRWTSDKLLKGGAILLDYLITALPETFVKDGLGDAEWLTITPGALALAERAVEQGVRNKPVFFPCTQEPAPWTDWFNGGYWDERTRLRQAVIHTHFKESAGAIRAAIRDGTMQPHLDALNRLQAVPWTINSKVLEVLKWAHETGLAVEGLPPKEDIPLPPKPAAWGDMDEGAQRLWKYRAGQVKERNRSHVSNRVLFAHDVNTAEQLIGERFWTPMHCDWRGRVYSIPHFNFQRDDRVRALFLFADGQPIGEEGLYWLKVHVANCGDFNKISKRSIEERVSWANESIGRILSVANSPTEDLWWTKADKPFLFLSACLELTACLCSASPTTYLTRLPISFDGSCSGLQHLCAMTRAAEGSLVNLTSNKLPQDVYQSVADLVTLKLQTASAEGNALANTCLTHGISRSVVKRNVMTYSYSSRKFGMSQQLNEDLMRPLAFDVLSGKRISHPFGEDDGRPAAKYLASLIYDAIETLVEKPAQAMAMLQKCARAMAHEGKPVTWTTPLGLPWINRYHLPDMKRLDLWLHDARMQMKYAAGHLKEIDKDRAANGVAPNFVHALDAAHLLMVANACASEDITQLATVHDSFGCLAPQAARFRQIIREQFVELYEKNDVLMQVLAQCKHDLTVHNQQRLPEVPAYGPLKLEDVLNADFAFA